MSPRLFYFNPLFDLELGGYPIDTVAASARQMSPLFALMGTSQDRILLDVNVPGAYWEYLDHNGIDHALPPGNSEDLAGFEAAPWGWNESSLERLTRAGARCDHPQLETVRAVNGRAWCAAFNADTGTGVPGARFCAEEQEFNRVLEYLEGSYPLVVKPAFGASGYGFVRMRDATGFSPDQRRAIGGLIARGGCVVEPWLDRIADLSSSCCVLKDGSAADLSHYRCHVTGHGAFFGVALGVGDPLLMRYAPALDAAARRAAAALALAGYFGPASFDAIVYRDAKSREERLAPVIEINARYGMSAIASALHQNIGQDRCIYLRFISRKKMRLPDMYVELDSVLGAEKYQPGEKQGILALSPLRVVYGRELVQPARSAFLCVASDTAALWKLDLRLRALG